MNRKVVALTGEIHVLPDPEGLLSAHITMSGRQFEPSERFFRIAGHALAGIITIPQIILGIRVALRGSLPVPFYRFLGISGHPAAALV